LLYTTQMLPVAEVRPLGPPDAVGNLFAVHDAAGIELRVRANLWPSLDDMVAAGLRFSGIRLRRARPRQ
jgi:hypothetical protein